MTFFFCVQDVVSCNSPEPGSMGLRKTTLGLQDKEDLKEFQESLFLASSMALRSPIQ